MARICMIVANAVSHDGRVLKEADSLARAGHDVTIIGIKNKGVVRSEESLSGSATIRRVPWRSVHYRRLGLTFTLAAVVAVLITATLLVLWSRGYFGPLSATASGLTWLVDRVSPRGLWPLWLVLSGVWLTWLFIGRARQYRRWARNHRSLELADEDRGDSSSGSPRKPTRRRTGNRAVRVAARLRNAAVSYVKAYSSAYLKVFDLKKSIRPLVLELRPDVIHAHEIPALRIGVALKRDLGCPLVYDAHEIYEDLAVGGRGLRSVNRHLQRRSRHHVDAFVTISDNIARFYEERYAGLDRATVIRNAAVPAGRLTYDGRLHEAADLPPEQRILLYQGGYSGRRNLGTLLAAAELMPHDWTLVMMGWGTLEQELRRRAGRVIEKTTDREVPAVRFIPPVGQQELLRWTAGATLGVIAYENWSLNHWFCTPNKLWEYPNAGVPVLASPLPELSHAIDTHGFGWLLPDPVTPVSIAEAVTRLSEEDLARAREACRRFIQEDNWYVYEKRLVRLYEDLLGRDADKLGARGEPVVGED